MIQINQSKFAKCTLLVLTFAITAFVFVNSIEANILTPNIVYGKNKTSSQSLSNTTHRTKLPSVRITSPLRGQSVHPCSFWDIGK